METCLTSLKTNINGVETCIEQKLENKFNEFIRTVQASMQQSMRTVTPSNFQLQRTILMAQQAILMTINSLRD